MSTYQVTVEQITLLVAQVQAESEQEAAIKALTGDGELIESRTLLATVKQPQKLGV